MARSTDYYNKVDRTDSIGYNSNAVNVLYTSEELTAIAYTPEIFGNEENYYLWLKAQAEENIIELLATLNSLITQAGTSDAQIGTYALLGSSVLSKTGFGVLAGAMLAGVGTLFTFLESKQNRNDLDLLRTQAKQVQTEILKQKAIYDNAVSELASMRNQRILFGLLLAFALYYFFKSRS